LYVYFGSREKVGKRGQIVLSIYLYVYFGSREKVGKRGQIVLFDKDGDKVSIRNPESADSSLDVLLIGGMPLNEPIAHYGPFVMNTQKDRSGD
jgi:redox-sensitive bicupin YhaK (pirin superfamily)